MMQGIPQFLQDMYVEAIKKQLSEANRQLFSTVIGPPPTDAQSAQWKLETEERKRKEQEALNKRFLGNVVSVAETYNDITLTYDDGRVETIDRNEGGWDDY